MNSTAEQMRAWRGPALLTFGFRPFFLGAAVWAVLIMALWVPILSGAMTLPTAFDPVSWHAHEFLFGYLSAVVAGFLLTAVPNWTGRLPIVGWPLGGLFALWVVGRVAVGVSTLLPPFVVAILDLAMPVFLGLVVAREIVAGKNWKNLVVLGLLAVFTLANALFHWEAARGFYAAQGYGLRLGVGTGVMMIAVIGGRIVPSFTRNWLVKLGEGRLPTPPMQQFDKVALLFLLIALLLWVLRPDHWGAGTALLSAGVTHAVRLARWAGHRTGSEPLVAVAPTNTSVASSAVGPTRIYSCLLQCFTGSSGLVDQCCRARTFRFSLGLGPLAGTCAFGRYAASLCGRRPCYWSAKSVFLQRRKE